MIASLRRAPLLGLRWLILLSVAVVTLAIGAYTFVLTGQALALIAGLAILPALWLVENAIGISDLRRQTLASIWFLTYLPMIFWPAFLVYVDNPGPFRDAYLFAVASALLTVPAGAALIARLVHSSRAERDGYLARPLDEMRPSDAMWLVCALAAIAIAVSVAIYFSMLSDIPLLYMFRYPGCDLVLAQLREETFKLLDPRWNAETATLLFYLFLPLRTIVDPFIVAALFGYWFTTRDRRWLFLFLTVFAIAGLYAASSLARAPLAALVLRMALLFYVLRAGRVGWRGVAGWALAILAFPLIVTAEAYRPGQAPSDCGPAATRAPEIGKAALVDPYLALTTLARQSPAPTPIMAPTRPPAATATGLPPTAAPPTVRPAIPTGPIPVPTLPPAGVTQTLAPVPVTATPSPSPTPSLQERARTALTTPLLLMRRLSYTSAFALYTYFRVFPTQHDWLWGQTLVKPFARLWGADFYVENFVYLKTYPTSPIPTGHLNAAFQSNFYADFGLPGVVLGGVVTGAIMHGLQIHLWRQRKTVLQLATFAVLVYAFWVLHSGSLTSVLLTNGVLPVLLIPPAMRLVETILHQRFHIR